MGTVKKAFQVTVAVPVHDRYGMALPDTECLERVGQSIHPFAESGVIVAHAIAIDDLLRGAVGQRGPGADF